MASLKDLLSEESKLNLSKAIEPGSVYRIKLTPEEGIIPKNTGDVDRNKYVIVLGKSDEETLFGLVIINSSINEKMSDAMRSYQYPISKEKYDFLDKNSFIHCGEIFEIKMSAFTQRQKQPSCGNIKKQDMDIVNQSLIECGTISKKILRRYGLIK